MVDRRVLVLASLAMVALGFLLWRVLQTTEADAPHQPRVKLDLVCEQCGHEVLAYGRNAEKPFPMKCPACGRQSLVLAAYCPECKTTLPLKDSNAFVASPYLATTQFAEKVFPRCPECGRLMRLKSIVLERKPE